jgi:hypothetical protein
LEAHPTLDIIVTYCEKDGTPLFLSLDNLPNRPRCDLTKRGFECTSVNGSLSAQEIEKMKLAAGVAAVTTRCLSGGESKEFCEERSFHLFNALPDGDLQANTQFRIKCPPYSEYCPSTGEWIIRNNAFEGNLGYLRDVVEGQGINFSAFIRAEQEKTGMGSYPTTLLSSTISTPASTLLPETTPTSEPTSHSGGVSGALIAGGAVAAGLVGLLGLFAVVGRLAHKKRQGAVQARSNQIAMTGMNGSSL